MMLQGRVARLRSLLLSVLATIVIGSSCWGQGEDPVEPLPEPSVFLDAVREAYRAGPIGEHVTVRVRDATGRRTTGRLRLLINVDPIGNASMVRIEFDPLVVWWGGGVLTAISQRDETTFYEESLPGLPDLEAISSALRPVPLPQLELAFSDDASLSSPTPYTPGTVWTSATMGRSSLDSREVVVITGDSAGRAVSLTIDPRTDRLLTLHAEIGEMGEPDAVVIDLEFRPFEPLPVEAWSIDTTRRETVDQLVDLLPRRGPVRVGDLSPRIELLDEATVPWRLGDALGAMSGVESPPHALALVLFRRSDDAPTQEDFVVAARRGMRAIDLVLARPPERSPDAATVVPGTTFPWRLVTKAGVVFRLGDYAPAAYRQLVARWAAETTRSPLLWDHSAGRSIDWFDPNAGAVLVLIGLDRTVLLIEPLDTNTDPDDLAQTLDAALRAAHPAHSRLPGESNENVDEAQVDDPSGVASPSGG
ncbi:hypothetical protein JYU07_00105 [Roseiflexus sp. AH-315-K22]|nr:hypothetical protein [Roseiflexus sp. AH-315-K22]